MLPSRSPNGLAAGRAEEAWTAINAVDQDRPGWGSVDVGADRLEVLETLGRADEAQAFRWASFERSLNPEHLRSYLKRLPDFEDLEAEEQGHRPCAEPPERARCLGVSGDLAGAGPSRSLGARTCRRTQW